ncbi:Spy/CpxP family protein refolding chaperone [Roseibium sp.]|uniref:Spy/CpxP family protein refolding chaperone n=1 Tax=Roseibium sp. TaxID=1936156 RepID=UPI003B5035BD
MLRKLENLRLKSATPGASRLIAACLIGTGILTCTAISVNSAPQATAAHAVNSHMAGSVQIGEVLNLHGISWRNARGGPGMLHRLSDEEIRERITRVVRHVAIEIDATQEQVDEIIGIVTPVALDLKATRKDMTGVGEELRELLLAQEVDRFAVEALRAEKLALADEVSKTLTGMMIEVADVLSPAQRIQLDERIKEFRAMRPGFRHH